MRRRSSWVVIGILALGAFPLSLSAQDGVAPARAELPPIHALGPVGAKSARSFSSLASIRALPGGRLLVLDVVARQVLMLDHTLAVLAVVADSTKDTHGAFASTQGGLIPYRNDSTLFVDPGSLSMVVIDPSGRMGRTIAVPRAGDVVALTGLNFGAPGFDSRGFLVYRTLGALAFHDGNRSTGAERVPTFPDSAAIVRADLVRRTVDTVAIVRTPKQNISVSRDQKGEITVSTTVHPLPVVDDWGVLSDGTVLIVRGSDFHADVIPATGSMISAGKMAHDWQKMTDDYKVAYLDSTKRAIEAGQSEAAAASKSKAGGPGPGSVRMVTDFVLPSELPDYKPPFAAGAARADADGNLWLRLLATRPLSGPLYAVIDRFGRLTDRVLLPPRSAVVGFGPKGVVYFGVREQESWDPLSSGVLATGKGRLTLYRASRR